jgi:hypothetical protein
MLSQPNAPLPNDNIAGGPSIIYFLKKIKKWRRRAYKLFVYHSSVARVLAFINMTLPVTKTDVCALESVH